MPDQTANAGTQVDTDAIKSIFLRRIRALSEHDLPTFMSDYAAECVVESPTFGVQVGRDAIERVMAQWFGAFPDTTFEHVDVVIDGARVVHMVALSGTDTGGYLGQPATRRRYRLFAAFVYRLDGHLIVHERRIYDVGGLLLQLARNNVNQSGVAELPSGPSPTPEAADMYR